MPTKTLARLLLAASLLAAPACVNRDASSCAADHDRPGTMTVTGTSMLEISPDCADLTMTIVGEGARPGPATAAVQKQQQVLVEALKKIGVEGSDVKLSHLRLEPVYAQSALGAPTHQITGYRAELIVTATTKRFDQVGSIMEAGANAGASAMSSQFRRSDLPELKKQLREMALKAAKDKAAQTAKSLGIQLGRIMSVAEAPTGSMWGSPYFPQVANEAVARTASNTLGGALQVLTLDVTIGFELARDA